MAGCRFSQLGLCERAVALGEVEPFGVTNDLTPCQGGAHGVLQVVELTGIRSDEHQHVAIDARRAAALHQDVLRLDQGVGAVTAIVRVRHAEHNCSHSASFVRHLGRGGRGYLHGVKMPAICKAIDIFSELGVDRDVDKSSLYLGCLVCRNAVEARRHRVPVPAKIGVHELGLVGQPPERIAEDCRALSGLHDAEIDLLVVQAGVLLLVCRRRSHKDRAGNSPRGRVAIQVRGRLIDLVGRGCRAIDIAGDDRLPAHVQISSLERRRRPGRHERGHRTASRGSAADRPAARMPGCATA